MQITGKPEELAMCLFKLDKDKLYEIKEYKQTRGIQANKYFHKLINELARYNRGIGHAISDEEMKININLAYGTIATDENGKVVGAKVPKGTDIANFYSYSKWYKEEDNCDCYIFYKRTSELDSKEFWQLLKGLECECKNVGIETLDDREFQRIIDELERSEKR